MSTISISNAINNATSREEVIEIINDAATGHTEGMEGLEFTPAMLAGQYCCHAAIDSGYGASKENIDGQLELLADEGAEFDRAAALEHGLAIAAIEAAAKGDDE